MYSLHPSIVHFPIVLLIMCLFFELIAVISKKDRFKQTAFILLVLAVMSCITASFSGELAKEKISVISNAKELLEEHENLGTITTYLSVFLLFFRVWAAIKKMSEKPIYWVYLLILAVTIFFVINTAYHGGRLVYQFGIGVERLP